MFLAKPGGVNRVRQTSSHFMIACAARNDGLDIIARNLRSAVVSPAVAKRFISNKVQRWLPL
jgi:hypothetical protein